MNKTVIGVFPLLAVLSLAGCTLQPKYERPALPVKNAWGQDPTQGASVANVKWRDFYRDSRLQTLISLALEHNRDYQVAALNVQTAQAQFRIERSALFPTIDANADKTAERLPGNLYSTRTSGPVTYQQYEANLGVTSWEVDLFGRLRSLRDKALESYLSTAATEKATRISLIAEVATGYLTLCADSDLLTLAKNTEESQNATWKLTQYRYQVGTANEQDVVQAEMSVRSAQADVDKYTRQVKQDIDALRLLLGTDIPAGITGNATLAGIAAFPALRPGLPSDLLTRRPDIIAAEHDLKAANANIGAARAAFFPSISLTAAGGTTSDSLGHLFEGGTAAWSFVPSISIPIFTGGLNKANLDVAKVSKRIEIANYEKAIQQAFKEVSDALAGETTYRDELLARTQDDAANARYFSLAQMRYNAGVDDYLNVLVAQRSYYQSQQDLISTRLDTLNQDITLYKVLGGGW
ncbi:efflux transporter outer membrane subunit [Martelella alba]|uniref:Efflux transporter outer membrane subunit n=1 Tax=Martelella alba TaxID=2590451 RepID=A0ABY2SKD7_9HYPH|nr:efflux transporter outer membrane subunit [Martelella alba]TKI05983.1 efflux transporter outer membrane subunit [Martelella alba]